MHSPDDDRVYVFLDTMPQRHGSGASLRFYSNVQAYLDLGFSIEAIQVATTPDGSEPSPDLTPIHWTRVIEPARRAPLSGRMFFRAGVPAASALEYCFPQRRLVEREVEVRRRRAPGAIYHFEGEWLSTVIPALPRSMRSIWSLHDLPSKVTSATIRIACDAQKRGPTRPERRELRFMQRMERHLARHSPLILGIAAHDCERLRREWGCKQTEYLPTSIPGDGAERRDGSWLTGGNLRLLHLGRVSHLPSYRSLEFLFDQVFPRLAPEILQSISTAVVGRVDADDDRARRILQLAAPYPNVRFHGFVADVVPFYQNSDLQVVASTEASGLRTRTIESFAFGLPVLSTSVGAEGIADLRAGEHLLIADDPQTFAAALTQLTRSAHTLARLSRNGREFYQTHQSRRVVASTLARCLTQYFGILPPAMRAAASPQRLGGV